MTDPDPYKHERSHFSSTFFERMGSVALSASGFSAALVIFLAQVMGQSNYSETALWAALCALLLWLCAWQYVEPYATHGEQSYGHFNFLTATLLSGLGLISLLISVAAIVLKLSICAGVVFSVLAVLAIIWVFVHNQSVTRHCKSKDS